MRLIYGVWSKIVDDPKIKLTDEEAKDFGEVHADFAQAWGFASSTKIEASLDVLMLHGTIIASRSKWVQELVASFGQKEEETLEPGRVQ